MGDGRSARSMERPARRRAWSCSSKAPRAAAGVHVVHGTLLESCWGGEAWWRGCWGASQAAGVPEAKEKRLCRVREAAASERRAGG